MTDFNASNVIIDNAATHPDGSFMFTAHMNDQPDVLYAYDKVGLKEECDGGWYLEYNMQVAAKKDLKVNEEELDSIGHDLIQYLFEVSTGVKS